MLKPRLLLSAVVAGILVAAAFALSPMSVWTGAGLVAVIAWAMAGLERNERVWLVRILTVAILARIVVLSAMFFYVSHPHLFSRELVVEGTEVSFYSIFGDESYAKRRSLWMRDVWIGRPLAPENYLRAFEAYGWTGYFDVLAMLQVWFGPMPFGIHLLNALLYLAGAVALYRAARLTYGARAALVGLTLVLLLPTLFIWSVTAMKEPMFFFLGAMAMYLSVLAYRSRHAWPRVAAAAGAAAAAIGLGAVRPGTTAIVLAAVAVATGVSAVMRWRAAMPRYTLVVAAALGVAALALPPVAHRALVATQHAARRHVGMVRDPGIAYRLLDERYYVMADLTPAMTARDAAVFVVRAVISFAIVPLPGQLPARSYVPLIGPQLVWIASLMLLPWGVAAGLRKDPFLTASLLAYSGLTAFAIAVISGNVGSLIRHRDIVVPFSLWISALGAVTLAGRWTPSRQERA